MEIIISFYLSSLIYPEAWIDFDGYLSVDLQKFFEIFTSQFIPFFWMPSTSSDPPLRKWFGEQKNSHFRMSEIISDSAFSQFFFPLVTLSNFNFFSLLLLFLCVFFCDVCSSQFDSINILLRCHKPEVSIFFCLTIWTFNEFFSLLVHLLNVLF